MKHKLKVQIHIPSELKGIEVILSVIQDGKELNKLTEILPPKGEESEKQETKIKILCESTLEKGDSSEEVIITI